MSELDELQPGILSGLWATARRDLLLAWKRPGDVLNPLFFVAMVCTLFPLAVGAILATLTFSTIFMPALLPIYLAQAEADASDW